MARRILVLASLVLVGVSAPGRLTACGDKFMLPPRGVPFEVFYRAAHPGLVVIYVASSNATRSSGYEKVQSILMKVGYRVKVVTGDGQLSQVSDKVDIILTDFSDVKVIPSQLRSSQPAPLVVAVLSPAEKGQAVACKSQNFACDLKITDRPEHFVATVNTAMNDRAKPPKQKPTNSVKPKSTN